MKDTTIDDVEVPNLGNGIGMLLCKGDGNGSYSSMKDGDFSIQLFGNSEGYQKLGQYFLKLAELDTSNDPGFHHHFCQIRSLSPTTIDLTVRKNKTADIEGGI